MTPALIRAARGLLNWQQQDLAAAANLSLSAVNNYERKIGKTRITTLQAMQASLEEAGIEFLPNGGLRSSEEASKTERFMGPGFIQKMNENIYAAIRKPGQEILTCSTDESQWFAGDVKKASEHYYKWRTKMTVKSYI